MRFTLNGKRVDVSAPPMKRLLDALREDCGLTGTKEGCGEGECGACTVLVDGVAVNSCLVPVAQVEGARVKTIEGLKDHPLQAAFAACGGAQCGICTPGMILAAATLPRGASEDEMREHLAGNLCRCTGYEAIFRAVAAAKKGTAPDRRPGSPTGAQRRLGWGLQPARTRKTAQRPAKAGGPGKRRSQTKRKR